MKTQKYICPQCRERSGVDILYGMPTIEAIEMSDCGELVLGGCCFDLDAPERQCLACGCQWRIRRQFRRRLQDEIAVGLTGWWSGVSWL